MMFDLAWVLWRSSRWIPRSQGIEKMEVYCKCQNDFQLPCLRILDFIEIKNYRAARKPAQLFDQFFLLSLCCSALKTWELPHVYKQYVAILHRNSSDIMKNVVFIAVGA